MLAKAPRLNRFFLQNFQAATSKQGRKPERLKIKTLAWKQVSHSAWLTILTCSFSGVFVCNLRFLLIVRVNVVSCWVTLYSVKYFFLVKIHPCIHITNSLLGANCMWIWVSIFSTTGKKQTGTLLISENTTFTNEDVMNYVIGISSKNCVGPPYLLIRLCWWPLI